VRTSRTSVRRLISVSTGPLLPTLAEEKRLWPAESRSYTVTMRGQERAPHIFRRLLLGGQRVTSPSRPVLRTEKLDDPIAADHRASDRMDHLIQADGNIFIGIHAWREGERHVTRD
jgi:hypothetical protein